MSVLRIAAQEFAHYKNRYRYRTSVRSQINGKNRMEKHENVLCMYATIPDTITIKCNKLKLATRYHRFR